MKESISNIKIRLEGAEFTLKFAISELMPFYEKMPQQQYDLEGKPLFAMEKFNDTSHIGSCLHAMQTANAKLQMSINALLDHE